MTNTNCAATDELLSLTSTRWTNKSPARVMPSSHLNSPAQKRSGSRSPDNIPIITHVASLSAMPTRKKRALGPNRENGEIKRVRIRDGLDTNTPNSPSTSTASPEVCFSPVIIRPDGGGNQAATTDNETASKDDDDDIMIVEIISSPKIKSAIGTFDISKVKSEGMVREEEFGTHMERGNSDTVESMETTASALPPVSSRDVSIGTQTRQIPAVKEEEEDSERKKKEQWSKDGVNDSNHVESEKYRPPVELNTNQQLKSINEEASQDEETQKRNKTKSTVKCEEELCHRDVSDERSTGGQTSAKRDIMILDVSDAQQQQDTLMELLEVASKERDESRSQLLLLSSQVEELRSQLLELTQSTLKKEQNHNSTQTSRDEAEDYKVLYLQGKEEIKQLQEELSELKMRKPEWESKGQKNSLECDDELACQIDFLLREVDQRNKEREDLKDRVDSLEAEKCTLSSHCENLQKDLEEIRRESEKIKVSVEDQGVQADFPISSHEKSAAASAEASNSGRGSDSHSQQHEAQDRPEIRQENNNPRTDSLGLRELRQKVARLLVTFVPALDLQQVNYDCEVIDEILTQVIDEISPTEAAST